jgi:hypothetical protein
LHLGVTPSARCANKVRLAAEQLFARCIKNGKARQAVFFSRDESQPITFRQLRVNIRHHRVDTELCLVCWLDVCRESASEKSTRASSAENVSALALEDAYAEPTSAVKIPEKQGRRNLFDSGRPEAGIFDSARIASFSSVQLKPASIFISFLFCFPVRESTLFHSKILDFN